MKKCPTCEKTYEDSMRFCQSDGTQLVPVAEAIDPYKTMVARPEDIAAAIPPKPSVPAHDEGEVLQIPKADPNKTMFVSEDEIRREMDSGSRHEEPVIEIPPAKQAPAPPAFIDADLNPVNVPPPKPIPYTPPEPRSEPIPQANQTTPPIPSPFSPGGKGSASDVSPMVPQFRTESKVDIPAMAPSIDEPSPKPEPPSPFAPPTPASPFDPPKAAPVFDQPKAAPLAQAEWTPPPVPAEASWQPPEQGGQAPPPAAAPAGQSKVMPIVSLIFGILSLCCYVSPITGLIALITGFLGMKNANSNPAQYGGKTMAIIGMIMGGLFFLIGIAYWIFLIFFGGLSMMMNLMNQR